MHSRPASALAIAHTPFIEEIRRTASSRLDPKRRVELGPFMTPWPIARFMASLFRKWAKEAKLLSAHCQLIAPL
jgi:hypothetical protein